VAGRRHHGLLPLQLDALLPARRLLPRQLRGHRRRHQPDLRVRGLLGRPRRGACPVPAAGRATRTAPARG
jgi:hypothetical protein